MNSSGELVISIDFELIWGMIDLENSKKYTENVEGARAAIPKILKLFKKYDIHATWATVGIMLNTNKKEIVDNIPAIVPNYKTNNISAYTHLDEVGVSSEEDKLHYAGELLNMIRECPHQEIASHSYSHYYCTEEGADIASFDADLQSSVRIIEEKCSNKVLNFVFPRNQYSKAFLDTLYNNGIRGYRGNPHKGYDSKKNRVLRLIQKVIRFLDSYIPIEGPITYKMNKSEDEILNIPASRFLRPYSGNLFLERLKIRRIKNQMIFAATHHELFHLWWHPHNFGKNTEEMLRELEEVLAIYKELNIKYGFKSYNMRDCVEIYCGK